MKNQYKSSLRWIENYLGIIDSNKVPKTILQKAFQECDIKDDQAIDRGLCLLCNNRELKPQTFVLVFAPEVKVSTTQRASSCTTSAPRVKHVKDSDLFLPLLRILSFVGDKGLKQDDTEASRWLKTLPAEKNIEGIPTTISKCVGDFGSVDTSKDDCLSNIQGLFSRLCDCQPLCQLKNLFKFHFDEAESGHSRSDTVITVDDRTTWGAIGGILFQQLPTFLAVHVRCPCDETAPSLQLQVGKSNPVAVTYNLCAFLGSDNTKEVGALCLKGKFYQVFQGGQAAEATRRQRANAQTIYLKGRCSFLIFEQETNELGTGQATLTSEIPEQGARHQNVKFTTRNAAKSLQLKEFKSRTIIESPQDKISLGRNVQNFQSRAPTSETASQKIFNRVEVSKQALEQLIKMSSSTQEHFAVINNFSKSRLIPKDLNFLWRELHMTHTEAEGQSSFVKPRESLKNTIVCSFSHCSFPEYKGCDQYAKFIFVEMLHMDVRSKYGCSHVMTVEDLSHAEIMNTYHVAQRTSQEKYETHLIEKGKGIMVALANYNAKCKSKDCQFNALQLPEIPDTFRPKMFGFDGNQKNFDADSHALLILGMLSEMAEEGCKVKDCDIPQDFFIKLPVSATIPRDDIIQRILNRWMILTCTEFSHGFNLMIGLYVTMLSRLAYF